MVGKIFGGAGPINHVISGRESAPGWRQQQQQPQTNQYYGSSQVAPAASRREALEAAEVEGSAQESTMIMDAAQLVAAARRGDQGGSATVAAAPQTSDGGTNGAQASNRNESKQQQLSIFPRSSIREPPLEMTEAAAAAAAAGQVQDARLNNQQHARQQQHPNSNQANQVYAPPRRSDDDDGDENTAVAAAASATTTMAAGTTARCSRAGKQAHRKRRRHRSTSGRSGGSPARSGPDMAAANTMLSSSAAANHTMAAAANQNNARSSTFQPAPNGSSPPAVGVVMAAAAGALTPDAGRTGAGAVRTSMVRSATAPANRQAISAHCWLIDSSDDQMYAPRAAAAARQPPQQQNCPMQEGAYKQPQFTQQHLTVAIMKQAQQKQQQLQQQQRLRQQQYQDNTTSSNSLMAARKEEGNAASQPREYQVHENDEEERMMRNFKTNSLRMERVVSGERELATASGTSRGSRKFRTGPRRKVGDRSGGFVRDGQLASELRGGRVGQWNDDDDDNDEGGNNHHHDLIRNFKTNSLKMERILNEHDGKQQHQHKSHTGPRRKTTTRPGGRRAAELLTATSAATLPARRAQLSGRLSCGSSSSASTSTLSSGDGGGGGGSSPTFHSSNFQGRRQTNRRPVGTASDHRASSTVLRLSALLSFVSGLVRRSGPSSSKCLSSHVQQQQQHCPAANSISGSVSAPSAAGSSSLAPYTAASLAISSSSSTSAYATGSSLSAAHLSAASNSLNPHRTTTTSHLKHLFQSAAHTSAGEPILLSQFNSGGGSNITKLSHATTNQCIVQPALSSVGTGSIGAGTATANSSSQFYSVSLAGSQAFQSAPASSHSYEYCGADEATTRMLALQAAMGETQFSSLQMPPLANGVDSTALAKPRSPDSTSTEDSSSSSAVVAATTTSSDHHQNPSKPSNGCSHQELEELRLAHLIMSDNELLPNGGDSGGEPAHQLGRRMAPHHHQHRLAAVVAPPSAARRRWWWNSIKDWLQRPCKRTSSFSVSGSEFEANGPGGPPAGQGRHAEPGSAEPAAARYKSLRSRHRANGSGSSTLQTIISLAKADRVFRCRLLASALVSCILLGLVCLLAGLIYSRLTFDQQQQRNKLSQLLIDDSDYDLSWLWPQQQQASSTRGRGGGHSQSTPSRLTVQSSGGGHAAGPAAAAKLLDQMDNWMRSRLIMIERSERLDQFQQTMAHLTTIQLANDNFIDLTQLAKHLEPSPPPGMSQQQATTDAHGTNESTGAHGVHGGSFPRRSPPRLIQLNRADHDLVSLTLLSNLHWPLVKWRHQNQQSVANFLAALAMQPVSQAFSGGAGTGTQTLRNLLALLMLSESPSPSSSSSSSSSSATSSSSSISGLAQLDQFSRLSSLLRSASYHIISCSYLLQTDRTIAGPSNNSLKGKFCKLLTMRYQRMMLTLSQLNHSHLSKLQAPIELASGGGGDDNDDGVAQQSSLNGGDQQQRHQSTRSSSSSKTLLGFFLDRLALLDPQSLAESVVASEESELVSERSGSQLGQLVGAILARDSVAIVADDDDDGEVDTSSSSSRSNDDDAASKLWANQPRGSLYELAKLIIGEDPVKLHLNLERNRDFQLGFQQAEADNHENWREILGQDLLYPWASFKLPQFVTVHSYDLFLHPNLTTRLVLGMLKIELQIERPTRYIVLNCHKLNLVDLSVWLKLPTGGVVATAANTNGSRSSNGGGGSQLRAIPIRRVLANSRFEQIYIELQEQIEPFSPPATTTTFASHAERFPAVPEADQAQPLAAGRPDFGELPLRPQADGTSGSHYARGRRRRNQFLINISFNKTSLMEEPAAPASGQPAATDQAGGAKEPGLEFAQYGDYFAQPEAEIKTILYTQFEPSNARRLFPCFDELHMKARFQLNLVHELQHQVLFNAPKRERVQYTSDGALQMSVFEPTAIPLSPYLVSFVVCDAQNIKSITSRVAQYNAATAVHQPSFSGDLAATNNNVNAANGNSNKVTEVRHIQVQILSQFEHLSQAEFASQLVPQLLAFYQQHLQFPYPMDKLDLVAIPKSLESLPSSVQGGGGSNADTVENMGLIWFKAPLLLVDTNLISQNLIEQISLVISHQLAHQYFGNIVSVRHWQDLWLYESLCQYLESIALASVQADWKLEEQFVVATIQETLALELFEPIGWLDSTSQPTSSAQQQQPMIEPQTAAGDDVGASEAAADSTADPPETAPLAGPTAQSAEQAQMPRETSRLDFEPDKVVAAAAPSVVGANGDAGQLDGSPSLGSAALSGGGEGYLGPPAGAPKKSSALLHMLLFNLLPSVEAQARLLRRCLEVYRYKTMGQRQFFRLFGEQLTQAGAPIDRLSLDLAKLSAHSAELPADFEFTSAVEEAEQPSSSNGVPRTRPSIATAAAGRVRNLTAEAAANQFAFDPREAAAANERVVFVRGPASGRQQVAGSYLEARHLAAEHQQADELQQIENANWVEEPLGAIGGGAPHEALHRHHQAASSRLQSDSRLADNLELVAAAWLERAGYPLVTASAYRDRIHLSQELFSFASWHGLLVNQGADVESSASSVGLHPASGASRAKRSIDVDRADRADVWPIPLMFVSRFNPKVARFFWMSKREMELPFNERLASDLHDTNYGPASATGGYSSPAGNSWFKLNVNQSSLVRVNYDERNWEALSELLAKSHYSNHLLGPLDRANLIDDGLTLMRCGKLSVGIAMNLTLYLEVGERDYQPWTSALRHLDQMQTLLNQNPLWHRYVLKLMQPISSVIGWKDDGPHLMRKLRRHLFSVALRYGDEKTVNKAKQEFKGWFRNGRFVVPNLQELVYVAGVRYGDQQEWSHCWQKYQQLVALDISAAGAGTPGQESASSVLMTNQTTGGGSELAGSRHSVTRDRQAAAAAPTPLMGSIVAGGSGNPSLGMSEPGAENEKRQLLTGLASTQNTWLLEQFLNYSLDPIKIQPHHLKHVMQTLGKNPVARLYLWRFVRLNWATLIERYMTTPDSGYETANPSANRDESPRPRAAAAGASGSEYYQVLETMIVESTKHFATKLDYEEVKAFFDAKRKQQYQRANLLDHIQPPAGGANWSPSVERAIQQSLQIIRSNIYWRDYIEPKLTRWLSHYDGTLV